MNAVAEDIGYKYPEIYAELFEMSRDDHEASIRHLWNGKLWKLFDFCEVLISFAFSELQQQCEENFELCQILEAQLPPDTNENIGGENAEDSVMYEDEQVYDEMDQDLE